MPIGERDCDSVCCKVPEAGQRISGKTGFGLLAIRDDGRSGFFETRDGIGQGKFFSGAKISV
jgi:hypothetical protein